MRIRPKLVVILAIAIMAPFAVLAHKAVGKSPVRMIRSTSGGSVSVALDGYDRKPWVSPLPGKLVIGAQAHLVNHVIDGQPFAWYFEARQFPGHAFYKQSYPQQSFIVWKGQTCDPTFDEIIDVEPGHTYHVFVGLMTNQNLDHAAAGVGFYEKVTNHPTAGHLGGSSPYTPRWRAIAPTRPIPGRFRPRANRASQARPQASQTDDRVFV